MRRRIPSERTEKDLIDSPWVQRLRYIYQLQSARWVYPSAEHTRFVHSLGDHACGRTIRAPPVSVSCDKAVPDLPSAAFVEEFLRITALVHDIGHGPFCHFFDDNLFARIRALARESSARSSCASIWVRSSKKSAAARRARSIAAKN
jgi:HD superfamily phosphohydrolase